MFAPDGGRSILRKSALSPGVLLSPKVVRVFPGLALMLRFCKGGRPDPSGVVTEAEALARVFGDGGRASAATEGKTGRSSTRS